MAALFEVVEKCISSQTKPVPSSANEFFSFHTGHRGGSPLQEADPGRDVGEQDGGAGRRHDDHDDVMLYLL